MTDGAPQQAAIEWQNVVYRAPNGQTVLDGLSLAVDSGEIVAVLGRSGSGKTTLLRLVNLQLQPTSGTVAVDGKALVTWDPLALRRHCGYVIQEGGLFPHLTCGKNVGILLRATGVPETKRNARIRELFSLVGLEPDKFIHRHPGDLSGGQRQRLGVARALSLDAPVLLMDEPFGALDPVTRAEMQQMLTKLLQVLSKTVVLVTHDLEEARRIASRLVLLEHGKVAADLPPEEFGRCSIPAVREYREAFHGVIDEAAR
jgi:osmoprotectant transport system ATP-binding protein